MADDPITAFYDQLKGRLTLEKGWLGLEPFPPIQFARSQFGIIAGHTVVAVVDARQSAETPAATFARVKDWFKVAIGGREQGVLIFVYSPAIHATVQEILKASWSAGARVLGGAYDLSTGEAWLDNFNLKKEIFGQASP